MVATRMLRVKVVLSEVLWRCSNLHRFSWPQRFTTAFRDLIEHTCCVWHFDTVRV